MEIVTKDDLPPLESDDPAWVAARRRETADGRRSDNALSPTGLVSGPLGQVETPRAVLDVVCRGRHVARVLVPDPEVALLPGVILQVACEARRTAGGGLSWWPLDCYVNGEVVLAVCRCRRASHRLSVNLIVSIARDRAPGSPRTVSVGRVAVESSQTM